jgi:O-6-methylguanine DNA methyltransferase
MNETVYYGEFAHRLGCIRIATTDRGLVQVGLPSETSEKFSAWLKANLPQASVEQAEPKTREVFQQLSEYFSGKRKVFTVELDLRGTEFQLKVWKAIHEIPYGQTISYGELARRIGFSDGARAVGAATGSNPIAIIVPCHRVVGSNGSLTGFGGGLPMKEFLLNLESGNQAFSFVQSRL